MVNNRARRGPKKTIESEIKADVKKEMKKEIQKPSGPKKPRVQKDSKKSVTVKVNTAVRKQVVGELESKGIKKGAAFRATSKKGLRVAATPMGTLVFDTNLQAVITYFQFCVARFGADNPTAFFSYNTTTISQYDPAELCAYFFAAWLQRGIDLELVKGLSGGGFAQLNAGVFPNTFRVPYYVAKYIEYYWQHTMPIMQHELTYPASDITFNTSQAGIYLTNVIPTIYSFNLCLMSGLLLPSQNAGFAVMPSIMDSPTNTNDFVLSSGLNGGSGYGTFSAWVLSDRPSQWNSHLIDIEKKLVTMDVVPRGAPDASAFCLPQYPYGTVISSPANMWTDADLASGWSCNVANFDTALALFMSVGNASTIDSSSYENDFDGRLTFTDCSPTATGEIYQGTPNYAASCVSQSASLEYVSKFIKLMSIADQYSGGPAFTKHNVIKVQDIRVTSLTKVNYYTPNINDFFRHVSYWVRQTLGETIQGASCFHGGAIFPLIINAAVGYWLRRVFHCGQPDLASCTANTVVNAILLNYQVFVPPTQYALSELPHAITAYLDNIGIAACDGFIFLPQVNFNASGKWGSASHFYNVKGIASNGSITTGYNIGAAISSAIVTSTNNMSFPYNQFSESNLSTYSVGQLTYNSGAYIVVIPAIVVNNPYLALCDGTYSNTSGTKYFASYACFIAAAECLTCSFSQMQTANAVAASGSSLSLVQSGRKGTMAILGVSFESSEPTIPSGIQNSSINWGVDGLLNNIYFNNTTRQITFYTPAPLDSIAAAAAALFRIRVRYAANLAGNLLYPYPRNFIMSRGNSLSDGPTEDLVTRCGKTGEITLHYLKNANTEHSYLGSYTDGSSFTITYENSANCLWQALAPFLFETGSTLLGSKQVQALAATGCGIALGSVNPILGSACAGLPFAMDVAKTVVDWTHDKYQTKYGKKMAVKENTAVAIL